MESGVGNELPLAIHCIAKYDRWRLRWKRRGRHFPIPTRLHPHPEG
jgi:hypothetical protein